MSDRQNTLRRGGELGPRIGRSGSVSKLHSILDEELCTHGSGWDESGPQSEQARQHAPHRQSKAKLSVVSQQHTSALKEPARSSTPPKRASGRLGDEKPMPEPPVSTAVTNDNMSGKATDHLDMVGNTAARANGPPGPTADHSSTQAEHEPPAAPIGATPIVEAEAPAVANIATTIASAIATALASGTTIHISFTPSSDGGFLTSISAGNVAAEPLATEPAAPDALAPDDEPSWLKNNWPADTPLQPAEQPLPFAAEEPASEEAGTADDGLGVVEVSVILSYSDYSDGAARERTAHGELRNNTQPADIQTQAAQPPPPRRGNKPIRLKLPNSLRGKRKWSGAASKIAAAFRAKPVRQQYARQLNAAKTIAAAARQLLLCARIQLAKSTSLSMARAFSEWYQRTSSPLVIPNAQSISVGRAMASWKTLCAMARCRNTAGVADAGMHFNTPVGRDQQQYAVQLEPQQQYAAQLMLQQQYAAQLVPQQQQPQQTWSSFMQPQTIYTPPHLRYFEGPPDQP